MSKNANEKAVLKELKAHLQVVQQKCGHFELVIGISNMLTLISQLQLALRHPGNKGLGAQFTRRLLDDIISDMDAKSPGIGKLLAMGHDPQHDVPRNT